MKKVLIVVDAQEDFTRGALRNEEAIKALPVIAEITRFAKDHGMDIVYTMDTHYERYLETQEGKNLPVPHCIYGTKGWEICKEVIPDSLDPLITLMKITFGSDNWWGWPLIDEADEVWMCGFCTDICVSANFQVLKAGYPELPITVISDACAGVTPELHEAALKVLKSCQAKVVTWEELKNEA